MFLRHSVTRSRVGSRLRNVRNFSSRSKERVKFTRYNRNKELVTLVAGCGVITFLCSVLDEPCLAASAIDDDSTKDIGVLPNKAHLLRSSAPIVDKVCTPEEVNMVLFHGGCKYPLEALNNIPYLYLYSLDLNIPFSLYYTPML